MKTEVVLIPGLHGTAALFDTFVAHAPAFAVCQAVALPVEGDQSFDDLAARLAVTLRPLDRFVLVAESFGGPIAARLTELLGERIPLLVLSNPLTSIPVPIPARLASGLMRSPWLPIRAVALTMTGGDRDLAEALVKEIRTLSPEVLAGRLATCSRAKGTDVTDHVSARLLTLLGTADRLISPSASRKLLEPIPNSTLVELDAPHLLLQTRPAEVWAAITREVENAG